MSAEGPVALVLDQVTRFYGSVIGLNRVNLTIGPGITGLVGSNGAGKSTLLKLASGQLRPSQGTVRVGGHPAHSRHARGRFGYSPDLNRFYEDLTPRQFVRTMARLQGLTRPAADAACEAALHEVGMSDRADRRLAGCSQGMRQRTKLAQALLHDPPLLLLDEPLVGIDPAGRHEIQAMLRRLAARGKSILVSSHILFELEQIAEQLVILARGRVVAQGTLAEIRQHLADLPVLVAIEARDVRRIAAALAAAEEVQSLAIAGERLEIRTANPDKFFRRVQELVIEGHCEIGRLEVLDATADAVFEYVESLGNGQAAGNS